MIPVILSFAIAEGSGIGAVSGFAVFGGIAFFLVLVAVAFIAYKMLKKTVKMAVRMAVVIAILAIAFVGSIALLWFGSGAGNSPVRPIPTTTQKPR